MKGLSKQEEAELIPEGTILYGYRGSIAHGMYVPKNDPNSIDDKDTLGMYVAPLDNYIGLKETPKAWERMQGEWDVVCYDVKKYFNLLLKCNPNVMSLLWLHPTGYIKKTELGELIIENRDIFVSRKAFHSFVGYAKGQAHRMEHHAFEGYMGEKRKQLVQQHGYDTKNAAHLIRLLRMGIEFLKDGELYVLRTHDATELLDIKKGKWTLEKVKDEADRLFKLAEEAFVRSTLPKEPDYERANKLLMHIIGQHHYGCMANTIDAVDIMKAVNPDKFRTTPMGLVVE